MPRSHAAHLDELEIAVLQRCFAEKRKPTEAAALVQCSKRIVYKYYAQFRGGVGLGTNPGRPRTTEYLGELVNLDKRGGPEGGWSESVLTGPVPKRPVPPPNCIPSVQHKLMAGRA